MGTQENCPGLDVQGISELYHGTCDHDGLPQPAALRASALPTFVRHFGLHEEVVDAC